MSSRVVWVGVTGAPSAAAGRTAAGALIGDAGIIELARGLAACGSVTRVTLDSNVFTARGVHALAGALASPSAAVTYVNLYGACCAALRCAAALLPSPRLRPPRWQRSVPSREGPRWPPPHAPRCHAADP